MRRGRTRAGYDIREIDPYYNYSFRAYFDNSTFVAFIINLLPYLTIRLFNAHLKIDRSIQLSNHYDKTVALYKDRNPRELSWPERFDNLGYYALSPYMLVSYYLIRNPFGLKRIKRAGSTRTQISQNLFRLFFTNILTILLLPLSLPLMLGSYFLGVAIAIPMSLIRDIVRTSIGFVNIIIGFLTCDDLHPVKSNRLFRHLFTAAGGYLGVFVAVIPFGSDAAFAVASSTIFNNVVAGLGIATHTVCGWLGIKVAAFTLSLTPAGAIAVGTVLATALFVKLGKIIGDGTDSCLGYQHVGWYPGEADKKRERALGPGRSSAASAHHALGPHGRGGREAVMSHPRAPGEHEGDSRSARSGVAGGASRWGRRWSDVVEVAGEVSSEDEAQHGKGRQDVGEHGEEYGFQH